MQLYGFVSSDVARLRKLLAAFERGEIRIDAPTHLPFDHQADSTLGYLSGSLASGATTMIYIVSLDTSSPPVATTESSLPPISVYNPYAFTVQPGIYLFTREPSQGYYVPAVPCT